MKRRTIALTLLALLPLLGFSSEVQAKHAKARKPSGPAPTGSAPLLVIDPGGPAGRVNQLLFTHDGRFLLSAGDDKVVRIWSLESGETVRALRGPIGGGDEGVITALALSPDDRYLAVGGIFNPEGDIRLYDFAGGQQVALLHGHEGTVRALAFSPDGRRLASGASVGEIILWDIASLKPDKLLRIHDQVVESLAFSPDGTRLVSGGGQRELLLWNARTGQPIRELVGPAGAVRSALFSPDGRSILSGSADGGIRLWNAVTGELVKDLAPGKEPVHGLALTPDGTRLVVRNVPQHACTVLAVPTGEALLRFDAHAATVTALAVAGNGQVAASAGGADHEIYLWDLATGAVLQKLVGRGQPVQSVGIAQDGRSFVFGDTPWDPDTSGPDQPEKLVFLDHGGEKADEPGITLRAKEADETSWRRAIDRSAAGLLRTWLLRKKSDAEHPGLDILDNGKVQHEIKGTVHSFTMTPDGKQVVVGGAEGFLALYNALTGIKRQDFVGHTGDVSAVTVSRGGEWLLSGSRDQTVRLWSLTQGTLLLTLFATRDGEWVAWTPQGYYASSLHGDRYVGWYVSQGAGHTAAYYPAAQFQQQFYRPDVVAEYLKDGDIAKALARADARRAPEAAPVAAEAAPMGIEAILPPRIEVTEPGKDG